MSFMTKLGWIVLTLIACGCIQEPHEGLTTTMEATSSSLTPTTTFVPSTTTVASSSATTSTEIGVDTARLYARVVDKGGGNPVAGALVFLGMGHDNCRTDVEGECVIEGFPGGDYSLNAMKRGYVRYFSPIHLNRGENYAAIALERQSEEPAAVEAQGTVIEVVAAKGTKSENHYIKLKGVGQEQYLFDEFGLNAYGEYVGKMVRVKGYAGMGFIGWQHQETEGIFVEEITSLV